VDVDGGVLSAVISLAAFLEWMQVKPELPPAPAAPPARFSTLRLTPPWAGAIAAAAALGLE